jgi:hypothetical protein
MKAFRTAWAVGGSLGCVTLQMIQQHLQDNTSYMFRLCAPCALVGLVLADLQMVALQ